MYIYSPVSLPLISGNNLFEFITYNTGSSAYFAAYVTDVSNNYLFSTDISMTGWNIMITGFYSNGYPVSSLLVNDSTSTAYTTGTAIIFTLTLYMNRDINKTIKYFQISITDKKNNRR